MAHQTAQFDHVAEQRGADKGSLLDKISTHSHWLLRVSLASVFVYHGVGKFFMLSQFAEMMQLSLLVAVLVALAETVGGVLVLAGAFGRDWVTRLGAAMFVPVMLGAISMVHWGQWSFMATDTHPMGGMEFQVTLLLISLYFVLKGNKA